MKISPSPRIPVELYRKSKVLRPTFSAVHFRRIVKLVRKFKRDSLIHAAISTLWAVWFDPSMERGPDGSVDETIFLMKRYASKIVVLAGIYSPKDSGADATLIDLRILIEEFHQALDSVSDSSWRDYYEIPRIRSRIAKFPYETPLKSISEDDYGFISGVLFRVRLTTEQWRSFSFVDTDWSRSWLIYKEFRALTNELRGPRLEEYEKRYLGTTFDRFVRAVWSLYAMFQSVSQKSPTPGFMDFDQSTVSQDMQERLGITIDDLKIASRRLGTFMSDFPGLDKSLDKVKCPIRKHAEPLELLSLKLIIILDEYARLESRALMPSPWKMMEAIRFFLAQEFVEFLISEQRETVLRVRAGELETALFSGDPIYSLRGRAFANYLKKAIGAKRGITDLDAIECGEGKKPDFLWLGERAAIFIEAKYRLKPNVDRMSLEPGTLLETWDTCLEAVQQASEFLTRATQPPLRIDQSATRRKYLVIVTEEALPEEVSFFRVAAKKWGWLDGTGLAGICLLTPAELEHLVESVDPDLVGSLIEDSWNALDVEEMSPELRLDGIYEATKSAPVQPHVLAGWNELFPGFRMRKAM